jgi:hypothetical protein
LARPVRLNRADDIVTDADPDVKHLVADRAAAAAVPLEISILGTPAALDRQPGSPGVSIAKLITAHHPGFTERQLDPVRGRLPTVGAFQAGRKSIKVDHPIRLKSKVVIRIQSGQVQSVPDGTPMFYHTDGQGQNQYACIPIFARIVPE